MKKVKISFEYECSPFWMNGQNILISELGLSRELQDEFSHLNEVFQKTLNQEYPPHSSFSSKEEKERFCIDLINSILKLLNQNEEIKIDRISIKNICDL